MNTNQILGPLRWHYPDQVVRVFLSLHKEGHPESNYITSCNHGSVEDASGNSKILSGAATPTRIAPVFLAIRAKCDLHQVAKACIPR